MLHILFACEATAHNVIVYGVSLNLTLENTLDKGKRRREGTNAKKAVMISQPSPQKKYVNNGRFPLSPVEAAQKGDVLVVWKLDWLARSLRHLIEFIETLRVKGVGFQSLSDGISTTTAGGQLVFHIMGALAIYYSRYNYHP